MPDKKSMTIVVWWVKIVDVHEGYGCLVIEDQRDD